ncbi:uncharacterized LOC118070394 [Chelonus insularis]|uniref:uncharacterized LOC118070394 n=1 Tax=Chelonus insularis TaxID=460826 RepID=UPI00158B8F65|nr:uncharacterized LOC118070394 [Chelonus insularis]KAG8148334.1 vlf-1b-1 protein [Chelonus insularis]
MNLSEAFYTKVASFKESTVSMHLSHVKKLQKLKINVANINNNNVVSILNYIKNTGCRRKKLSNSYVNVIYSTLRLLNSSLDRSASKMGFPRKHRTADRSNNICEESINDMKQLFKMMLRYIKNFTSTHSHKFDARSIIDTSIAVVLLVITNLQPNEIFELKFENLQMMADGVSFTTTVKKRKVLRTISVSTSLYNTLYTNIEKMILNREKICDLSVNDKQYINKKNEKVNKIHVISCTRDSINKTIYEMYVRYNKRVPFVDLGLTFMYKIKNEIIKTTDEFFIE